MSEHLHHKLAVLHQNLLHGKLPRDLRWAEALELVEHLGQVQPHGGGEFAFIVGGQRELFKRPHGSDLEMEEVSRLRKFLKLASAEPGAKVQAPHSKMVVVIDHHAAHVFHNLDGSPSQGEVAVKPYDPHRFRHHLVHRKEAHYEGERVPEATSFYQEIAKTLVPAGEIVLIGHGVGKSSAVDVLVNYLTVHHPDIARCVKAVETADLSALTQPEIEAIAKRYLDTADEN